MSFVAIVGSGISGLTLAHLLHGRHDVTVFEAGAHAGGHANTVRVDLPDETHDVDTGFVVFNDRNYPNFERLLTGLGVASQPTTMSFSVSAVEEDIEYAGTPRGLVAQPGNLTRPAFVRMIGEYAPTPRNSPCKDFYPSHFFEVLDATRWTRSLASPTARCPEWISIEGSLLATGAD